MKLWMLLLLTSPLVIGCTSSTTNTPVDPKPDITTSDVASDVTTPDAGPDVTTPDAETPDGAPDDAGSSDATSAPPSDIPSEDTPVVPDTTGSDATPGPDTELPTGCTPADIALMEQTLLNPPQVMSECAETCGAEDIDCIVSCFSEKTGLSLGCAGCFAPVYTCLTDVCAESCDDLSSDACEQCGADKGCFMSLLECMQPPDPNDPKTTCDAQDAQQLQAIGEGILEIFTTCGEQCPDDEDCLEDCIEAAALISEDCAECYADGYLCVLAACDVCAQDPASEACDACVEDSPCASALASCVQMGPGPGPGPPVSSGVCTVWDMDKLFGAEDPLLACFNACGSDDVCFDTCAKDKVFGGGLEGECADCWLETYSMMYSCAQQNCADVCEKGLDDQVCGMCVDQSCGQMYFQQMFSCFPAMEPACGPGEQAALTGAPKMVAAALQDCVASCGSADAGCFSACVQDALGKAPDSDCADCFGGLYQCVGGACPSCEGDWSSPACYTCMLQSNCFPPFQGCSGVELNPPPPPANFDDIASCPALGECIAASCYYGGTDCYQACVDVAQPEALVAGGPLVACFEENCLNAGLCDANPNGGDPDEPSCWAACIDDKCMPEAFACADSELTAEERCADGLGCVQVCPPPGAPGGISCAAGCLAQLAPGAKTDLAAVAACANEGGENQSIYTSCPDAMTQCLTEGVTGPGACYEIGICQSACVSDEPDTWNSENPVCLGKCLKEATDAAQGLFLEAFGCVLDSGQSDAGCLNKAIACGAPAGEGECSDLTACLYSDTCNGDFFCLLECLHKSSPKAAEDFLATQVCPLDCEESCKNSGDEFSCTNACMQEKCDPLWELCAPKEAVDLNP